MAAAAFPGKARDHVDAPVLGDTRVRTVMSGGLVGAAVSNGTAGVGPNSFRPSAGF
jgi:hypothetical protein